MENKELMTLLGIINPINVKEYNQKYHILQFNDDKNLILASEFQPRLILAKVFHPNNKINDIDINSLISSINFAVKRKLNKQLSQLEKKFKTKLIMVIYNNGRTVLVCPKLDNIIMDKVNPDEHDFNLAYKKYLTLKRSNNK